jgi:hypothetical protein
LKSPHCLSTRKVSDFVRHHQLDMAFREDECCVRKGYGAEKLARFRHIALNLLKQDKTAKVDIKNKRHKAGWALD